MAWRDKLLIKGLEHSASEYLVTGKAAQPAWERALFLTAQRAARVGWGAGICAAPGHKEWGLWGAGSVGSCSPQPCWGLDGSTGLLLHEAPALGRNISLSGWCRGDPCTHPRGRGLLLLPSTGLQSRS